jgi:hypothetical protein
MDPAATLEVDQLMDLSTLSPHMDVDLAVQPVRLSYIASQGSVLLTHIFLPEEITALSGPNGHIDFLDCGINGKGWNPPLIKIEGIVTVNLSAVAYQSDSAFVNCQDFVSTFEKYGSQYGSWCHSPSLATFPSDAG